MRSMRCGSTRHHQGDDKMTNCPGLLGRGGVDCSRCLSNIDLNKTIVASTERQGDFKFESDVILSACSGGKATGGS